MTVDVKPKTVPVLIHVPPEDWESFKLLAGRRQASKKIRAMIRRELKLATTSR